MFAQWHDVIKKKTDDWECHFFIRNQSQPCYEQSLEQFLIVEKRFIGVYDSTYEGYFPGLEIIFTIVTFPIGE